MKASSSDYEAGPSGSVYAAVTNVEASEHGYVPDLNQSSSMADAAARASTFSPLTAAIRHPASVLREDPSATIHSQKIYFWNFLKFCVSFSMAHASVNGVLANASTLLGSELGSYGNFMLYIWYSFSNVFIAKSVLSRLGPKWTVFAGMTGMLAYVGSFLVAVLTTEDLAWPLFLIGASIGGVGAGLLWVGQGMYFSRSANAHVRANPDEESSAYSDFAGFFALCYLGIEMLVQLFALFVYVFEVSHTSWMAIVFGTYTLCALVGLAFVRQVIDLGEQDSPPEDNPSLITAPSADVQGLGWFRLGLRVFKQMWSNRKEALIIPFQLAFGLSAGFINFYVNRTIVAEHHGPGYVGLMMAIATFTSAVMAYPISNLSNYLGSSWLAIVVGCVCFALQGLLILVIPTGTTSLLSFLVIYYIIHGVAKCVWEGQNKAVILDYFATGEERENVFAAITFTSGISGAFGFGFYQYMNKTSLCTLNTAMPLVALLCFHISSVIQQNEKRKAAAVRRSVIRFPSAFPVDYSSKSNGQSGDVDGSRSGSVVDEETVNIALFS